METGILSRIRQIIEYYSLSERQFAITIGIRQPMLNTMFHRNQDDVKLTTIVKIVNAFPEVSVDWLVMARRTFVGCLYEEGFRESDICSMSGHQERSISIQRYRRTSDDIKQKMIDSI